MISALGELNSELLTMHYGPVAPTVDAVSSAVRRATALQHQAELDLRIARGQQLAIEDEVRALEHAAVVRHVARYTTGKNTMCVGPCVYVARADVPALTALRQRVLGEQRPTAIQELATALRKTLTTQGTDQPRLCQATGLACAAARFNLSDDVRLAASMTGNVEAAARRVRHAAELVREAQHTMDLVNNTRISRIRELEIQPERLLFRGGQATPPSTPDRMRRFFKEVGIRAPLVSDMKTALDRVSVQFAPRAREHIVRDLWARWLQFE